MSVNINRVHKLMRLACDPAANANEAHSAAINAAETLRRAGASINDLSVDTSTAEEISNLKAAYSRLVRENAMLQWHLDAASKKNSELLNEINEAKQEKQKLAEFIQTQYDSIIETANRLDLFEHTFREQNARPRGREFEYQDFRLFADAAMARCGNTKWKSSIALALGMSVKEMNAWDTVGIFPTFLVEKMASFSDAECSPSRKQRWTDAEQDRLKAMCKVGATDLEIAIRLGREFGRKICETSVTYRRRRFQREQHRNQDPRSASLKRRCSKTPTHVPKN